MAICGISIQRNNLINLEKKKEAYSSWSVKQFFPGLVLIDDYLWYFYRNYNVSWREKSLAPTSISVINVIEFKLIFFYNFCGIFIKRTT